jgi:hypothetical protein
MMESEALAASGSCAPASKQASAKGKKSNTDFADRMDICILIDKK